MSKVEEVLKGHSKIKAFAIYINTDRQHWIHFATLFTKKEAEALIKLMKKQKLLAYQEPMFRIDEGETIFPNARIAALQKEGYKITVTHIYGQ